MTDATDALRAEHGRLLARLTSPNGGGPKDLVRLQGEIRGVEKALAVLNASENDEEFDLDPEKANTLQALSDARLDAREWAREQNGDEERESSRMTY